MTQQDKEELLAKIVKLGVSNNDTAAYGNGFEDAITLVEEVINTLPIHDVVGKPREVFLTSDYIKSMQAVKWVLNEEQIAKVVETGTLKGVIGGNINCTHCYGTGKDHGDVSMETDCPSCM